MSTLVVFFGGYQATQSDMDAWLYNARGQRSDVEFVAFAWPRGASSDAKSAISGSHNRGQFKAALAAIQASSADTIYIVGHSSGCAIANAVDKALADTSKISLVALDGFSPDPSQLQRSTTQVWGARCGNILSMNFPHRAGARQRVFETPDCKTKWALHFSVVNMAAMDSLIKSVATGYAQCRSNLEWL
jgi:hypothetical protein